MNRRMRLPMVFLLGLIVAGCGKEPVEKKTEAISEDTVAGSSTAKPEPSVIQTPEIVRILAEERIKFVGTSHAQAIYIQLEDGREFQGKYVHAQADKYAEDEKLFDILNLVMHIKKNRPPEEVEGWHIVCE